ncbi:MAG: RagB/SusD family nutrient uptake outer membrane protein [Cyclobacteriaceae bacterium]|nr:RagB/SusD family nutrient uptake outer membrane protein [Cyclobacteriaceae bacterium]
MKNTKFFQYGIGLLTTMVVLAACSEDFLERPPKDAIVDGNFYQSDDQVMAGTALLYSQVWFDYNDKASYNLGDFRGGSAFSAWNDQDNVRFNTTANTPENGASWRAFFNVVGQSNTAIQNINRYAGEGVSPNIKRHAIAEARFMRALAYRFLVMNWGPVPIITNNQTLLSDTTISRNTVESVWKFITNEMRGAAADLTETPLQPGRLTKVAAEAMLARFYLNRAGVGQTGSRNQVFLDSAKYFAKRVIDSKRYKLLPKYESLFLFPYDNNEESIFELQWVFSGTTTWGTQNSTPAYLAYSPDIANGDGWGGDKGATLWVLNQYEGLMENGRTLDQRLKATFMLPGAQYPEITQNITLNGKPATQRLIFPFTGTDQNFASIKKYVTGQAVDNNGEAASQRYGHDTYMMRLAEVYLIYAEAALGNAGSTLDATALEYFNAVHMRSGLPKFEDPLTFDDIFRERVVEFAMEGMCWYDLVSLHYYNANKAYGILNSQDRGGYFVAPNQFPDPTSWTITPTSWWGNRTINAYAGNFLLPIPAAELSQAPNLRKEPVDYYAN